MSIRGKCWGNCEEFFALNLAGIVRIRGEFRKSSEIDKKNKNSYRKVPRNRGVI